VEKAAERAPEEKVRHWSGVGQRKLWLGAELDRWN
jgi:hypothetical protein